MLLRLPTASKLDLFERCVGPWQLPLSPREESDAAREGKALHLFAETGKPQAESGRISADEERVERALADLPAHRALYREAVCRYCPTTGEAGIITGMKGARPYGDSDDVWIWGTADVVGELADSSLLLADLKTGSPHWLKMPWGPGGALRDAPLQIPFLAAVFARALDRPAALCCCVSSQAERAFCARYSRDDLEAILARVSGMVHSPPTSYVAGDHCTFCPVRGNCPLYGSF